MFKTRIGHGYCSRTPVAEACSYANICQQCDNCRKGLEQYCREGNTGTYNAPDKISGGVTYGGYSNQIGNCRKPDHFSAIQQ